MNKYKYKEAFVILTDWFHSYVDHNGVKVQERHITEEYKEAKQTIQELVEKATPKKAILVHDYDGYVYECPKCHNEFRPDYIMYTVKWNGCPYCLQALDWSDEE